MKKIYYFALIQLLTSSLGLWGISSNNTLGSQPSPKNPLLSTKILFTESMQAAENEFITLLNDAHLITESELYFTAAQTAADLAEYPPEDIIERGTLNLNTRRHILILELYHLAHQAEVNYSISARQRFIEAAVFYQAAYIIAAQIDSEHFIPLLDEHIAQRDEALARAIENTDILIAPAPTLDQPPAPVLLRIPLTEGSFIGR